VEERRGRGVVIPRQQAIRGLEQRDDHTRAQDLAGRAQRGAPLGLRHVLEDRREDHGIDAALLCAHALQQRVERPGEQLDVETRLAGQQRSPLLGVAALISTPRTEAPRRAKASEIGPLPQPNSTTRADSSGTCRATSGAK